MDQAVADGPVILVIRAPNQKYDDQTINCCHNWTVEKLKAHLSDVYPSKPVSITTRIVWGFFFSRRKAQRTHSRTGYVNSQKVRILLPCLLVHSPMCAWAALLGDSGPTMMSCKGPLYDI